jgi:hypothetical protein
MFVGYPVTILAFFFGLRRRFVFFASLALSERLLVRRAPRARFNFFFPVRGMKTIRLYSAPRAQGLPRSSAQQHVIV